MERGELIEAVNDILGTLKRDFGVKIGVSLFLILYKTDEDGNGRDIDKRHCPQS
jgi:hypothetical protein